MQGVKSSLKKEGEKRLMERINKLYVVLGMLIALGLFFGIAAYADEADQATTKTFSAPVDIPGHVLPPGTYLFKLANDDADVNVVQIFNSRGTKLYATLHTVPTERGNVAGHTVITLVEQPGAPDALLRWFYPGSQTGNEFVYSDSEMKELARDVHKTVVIRQQPTNVEFQAAE